MRKWLSVVLTMLLFMSGTSPVLAAGTSDPLLMTPDFAGPPYPIGNYGWDADGFFGRFDAGYVLANLFMGLAVFLVRFSIWVLNLGYSPSQWLSPYAQIAEAIQSNRLLEHIWPFFVVVAAVVLIKDLAQHHVQRAMRRGLAFVISIVALILFQAIGTANYLTAVTKAIDTLAYATSGWILTWNQPAGDGQEAFQRQVSNIDREVWQRLIDDPWQLGEMGSIGETVGDDADKVRSITGESVSSGTPWRDVLLKYPVASDARSKLAAILNSEDHPDAQAAFSSGNRLILGLLILLSAAGAALYFLVVGLYLLGAYFLYLAAIVSGIVILPLSLLPWEYSEILKRWFFKTLAGSVFVKVALSAYIGLSFLPILIISPALDQGFFGGGITLMLLYPVWFVLALWVLHRIQKRWRPVHMVTGGVTHKVLGESDRSLSHTTRPRNPEQQTGLYRQGEVGIQSREGHIGEVHAGNGARRIDPESAASAQVLAATQASRPKPGSGSRGMSMQRTLRKAGMQAVRGQLAGAAVTFATGVAKEGIKDLGKLGKALLKPPKPNQSMANPEQQQEQNRSTRRQRGQYPRRIDPDRQEAIQHPLTHQSSSHPPEITGREQAVQNEARTSGDIAPDSNELPHQEAIERSTEYPQSTGPVTKAKGEDETGDKEINREENLDVSPNQGKTSESKQPDARGTGIKEELPPRMNPDESWPDTVGKAQVGKDGEQNGRIRETNQAHQEEPGAAREAVSDTQDKTAYPKRRAQSINAELEKDTAHRIDPDAIVDERPLKPEQGGASMADESQHTEKETTVSVGTEGQEPVNNHRKPEREQLNQKHPPLIKRSRKSRSPASDPPQKIDPDRS